MRKCTFCAERQAEGQKPACAAVCPTGALTFGKRGALIELAKTASTAAPTSTFTTCTASTRRAARTGCTSRTSRFEKLALRTVRDEPYPDKVQGALSAPPFVMTLWPPLLMGLYAFAKRRNAVNGNNDGHGGAAAGKEDRHV